MRAAASFWAQAVPLARSTRLVTCRGAPVPLHAVAISPFCGAAHRLPGAALTSSIHTQYVARPAPVCLFSTVTQRKKHPGRKVATAPEQFGRRLPLPRTVDKVFGPGPGGPKARGADRSKRRGKPGAILTTRLQQLGDFSGVGDLSWPVVFKYVEERMEASGRPPLKENTEESLLESAKALKAVCKALEERHGELLLEVERHMGVPSSTNQASTTPRKNPRQPHAHWEIRMCVNCLVFLFNKAVKMGTPQNALITCLIRTLSRDGNTETALDLFEHYWFGKDLAIPTTRNLMSDESPQTVPPPRSRRKLVATISRSPQRLRNESTLAVASAALHALVRAQDLAHAWSLFVVMSSFLSQYTHKPFILERLQGVYSMMLDMYGKTCNLSRMKDVLEQLKEHSIPMTAVIYDRLIEGFGRCGRYDLVKHTFGQLLNSDSKPSMLTFMLLIDASGCCKANDHQNYFNQAAEYIDDTRPLLGPLLEAHLRTRNYKKALIVLRNMQKLDSLTPKSMVAAARFFSLHSDHAIAREASTLLLRLQKAMLKAQRKAAGMPDGILPHQAKTAKEKAKAAALRQKLAHQPQEQHFTQLSREDYKALDRMIVAAELKES